ncbi:hypothetical protein [Streptomyces sp. NRRL B-24085]|uniref:hypothetical protein n=1 Tax=Streptomyces sp. NRRL B-24085 TaxID=1709476 RepID=UPI00131E743F|nr:hypothetical protein [Streptomyces sp. NRRL B-24085]
MFRTSETSWLLELTRESWDVDRDRSRSRTEYARLTVAELVAPWALTSRPVSAPAAP